MQERGGLVLANFIVPYLGVVLQLSYSPSILATTKRALSLHIMASWRSEILLRRNCAR